MTGATPRSQTPVGCSPRLWRALGFLAAVPIAEPSDAPNGASGLKDGVERGENLVVEFDEAYTTFVEAFERLPSESQMLALQAVDTKLAAMVRAQDATLWTARALQESTSWRQVRSLAGAAMDELERRIE